MANLDELEVRVQAIEAKILSAVIIPSYAKDVVDASVKVGDYVIGKKAGINGGFMFFGKVNTAPPTQDSHIDDLIPF